MTAKKSKVWWLLNCMVRGHLSEYTELDSLFALHIIGCIFFGTHIIPTLLSATRLLLSPTLLPQNTIVRSPEDVYWCHDADIISAQFKPNCYKNLWMCRRHNKFLPENFLICYLIFSQFLARGFDLRRNRTVYHRDDYVTWIHCDRVAITSHAPLVEFVDKISLGTEREAGDWTGELLGVKVKYK